ncbi:sensor histidine kinase [Sphingomonas alpina]|uniref:Histidine kinase n=1 Tax=Sphingomonas alpina TaxID=653931 RepID=A0A7H0LF55_9SPHN|nr:histidine kinase [Sphingomonas alpina]QNQ08308.1 histidine kinase [Sphingomonas alpina]
MARSEIAATPCSAPVEKTRWISPRRRSALLLIAAFWIFTFGMLSIRAALVSDLPFNVIGPRRLVTAAFGTILCLVMVRLLDRLRTRSFVVWVVCGMAGAIAMAFALTSFATLMNRVIAPLPGIGPLSIADMAQWVLIWLGYCLAWTGTYLALIYHWQVQDQRQHMSRMTSLAQEAQIAALRYQVNPHFLFNTLNSISSLVLDHRNADAEVMLLNLSAFVRSTFDGDPQRLIPLHEEIELQRFYLGIEQVRFSERLRVIVDIPDAVADTLVPALILQPLVENALRHGVEQSEALTSIAIRAMQCGGNVQIVIEDDGVALASRTDGTGVGLRNVRDRLAVHFGDRATLATSVRPQGGFCSEIRLPIAMGA